MQADRFQIKTTVEKYIIDTVEMPKDAKAPRRNYHTIVYLQDTPYDDICEKWAETENQAKKNHEVYVKKYQRICNSYVIVKIQDVNGKELKTVKLPC